MDKVQVSVCSRTAFGVCTLDGVDAAPCLCVCVMPRPRRKCGLFKQCRLSARLFRLGSLLLSQSVRVCACVCSHFWPVSASLFRKEKGPPRGSLSYPKTKFPRFLPVDCVWSAPASHEISTHLDVTPPSVLAQPRPPDPSGDVSSGSAKGVSPGKWFQFKPRGEAPSSLWVFGFHHSRFLQKSLGWSQHIFFSTQ